MKRLVTCLGEGGAGQLQMYNLELGLNDRLALGTALREELALLQEHLCATTQPGFPPKNGSYPWGRAFWGSRLSFTECPTPYLEMEGGGGAG